jgi:hypothetical protein
VARSIVGSLCGLALGAWIAVSAASPRLILDCSTAALFAIVLEARIGWVLPGPLLRRETVLITFELSAWARSDAPGGLRPGSGDQAAPQSQAWAPLPFTPACTPLARAEPLLIAARPLAELRRQFGDTKPCANCGRKGSYYSQHMVRDAVKGVRYVSYGLYGNGYYEETNEIVKPAVYESRYETCRQCQGRGKVELTADELLSTESATLKWARPVVEEYNREIERINDQVLRHNASVPWRISMLQAWARSDDPADGHFEVLWRRIERDARR